MNESSERPPVRPDRYDGMLKTHAIRELELQRLEAESGVVYDLCNVASELLGENQLPRPQEPGNDHQCDQGPQHGDSHDDHADPDRGRADPLGNRGRQGAR